MRDININHNNDGNIIDKSISIEGNIYDNTFIVNGSSDEYNNNSLEPQIYVKETSIKALLLGRRKELLMAVLPGAIALVSNWGLINFEFEQTYKWILIGLSSIALVSAVGLVITALEGIPSILGLKKKGAIKYLKSPLDLIEKIVSLIVEFILKAMLVFFSSESTSLESNTLESNKHYISPKGVYQNIDGKIYELEYAKCPYCELEPIGRMDFFKEVNSSTYMLICNQQEEHRMPYDYKKRYRNMKIIR